MTENTEQTPPGRPPILRIAGFLVGNWPSRIYLALVLASVLFAVASITTYQGSDANLAAVWPILMTLPWTLLFIWLVPDSGGVGAALALVGIVTVATLLNMAIISWLVRLVRRRLLPGGHAPGRYSSG